MRDPSGHMAFIHVASTSMQHHDVASTLIRPCLNVYDMNLMSMWRLRSAQILIIICLFLFGFYGLFKNSLLISSRAFIKGRRKPENPGKTTWPSVSRTWLSHMCNYLFSYYSALIYTVQLLYTRERVIFVIVWNRKFVTKHLYYFCDNLGRYRWGIGLCLFVLYLLKTFTFVLVLVILSLRNVSSNNIHVYNNCRLYVLLYQGPHALWVPLHVYKPYF